MRRFFITVAALCVGTAVSAETLRLSHSYTEDDTRHRWAEKIAELVDEKTDGAVTVEIFPNQQLFKAREQYNGLVQNRIDLAIYPLPWLSGRAPLAEIGALPGVVSEPADGLEWRSREIWPMLQEAVAETGVTLAGGGFAMGTIGNTGEPILLPEDMDGHKMRGLGRATEAMMMANGATITSLPASEIYQALQTGVLSGVLTIYSSFEGYNLQEVVDHMLIGKGFVGAMHGLLAAPGLEDKIGTEHYEAVLSAVEESEAWFVEAAAAEQADIAAAFEAAGVTVHRLDDDQAAAWQADAEDNAWSYFRENVPNGDAALEALTTPLSN
ncbi:TRAP transporter substrate-binding protein [Roseivivax isoporae]|nr:TRAP transporter substrate-binding protein DctP [Roseivivax isoporae]